jgi:hypothetical protein
MYLMVYNQVIFFPDDSLGLGFKAVVQTSLPGKYK